MSISLSIVIPLFNEEHSLTKVIEDHVRVLSDLENGPSNWEIICLDDASTDRTWEQLQQCVARYPQMRLLRHKHNCGITLSFIRLFQEAKGDYIYLTLKRLFDKLKESQVDLVIGVREERDKVYNWWRKCLSYGFNFIAEYLLGIQTKDANGIKLGKKEIFNFPLRSKSFFSEIERIHLAHKNGYKITYTSVLFLPRSAGKEHGAKFKNVLATFVDLVRFLFTHTSPRAR